MGPRTRALSSLADRPVEERQAARIGGLASVVIVRLLSLPFTPAFG